MAIGTIVNILQIITSALLIVAIVLQQRGSTLGGAFGGSAESYHTKRGLEKFLLKASVILSILFLGLAFLNLFI